MGEEWRILWRRPRPKLGCGAKERRRRRRRRRRSGGMRCNCQAFKLVVVIRQQQD
jgi:hypothetical protein